MLVVFRCSHGCLVKGHGRSVPLLLVSGQRVFKKQPARQAVVDSMGQKLGVPKSVAYPKGRDGILAVTGVAHQRPARTEGLSKEVR